MQIKHDEQGQSMQERAYWTLLKRMLSGELPAGTPLSEASLARELGISRTPLREAIRRLATEGFLRQTPNRGSNVVEFSKRDIAELYELREALEVYVVGKAAEHTLHPSDLETLQGLVKDVLALRDELLLSGEARLSPEQMQRFVANDLNFHATLVRSAANRRILKVIADTRVLINIFAMRRKGHTAAQLLDIHGYHSEVVGAVVRKEVELAIRLIAEHIQVSKQERLRDYDEWEHEFAIRNAGASLAGLVG